MLTKYLFISLYFLLSVLRLRLCECCRDAVDFLPKIFWHIQPKYTQTYTNIQKKKWKKNGNERRGRVVVVIRCDGWITSEHWRRKLVNFFPLKIISTWDIRPTSKGLHSTQAFCVCIATKLKTRWKQINLFQVEPKPFYSIHSSVNPLYMTLLLTVFGLLHLNFALLCALWMAL